MEKEKDSDRGIIITAIIAAILIIGLWLYAYFSLKDYPCDERGTFGDMFGGVNALFSGFALTGIILTILLQRKELRLQREELADTRKEFIEQNKTLRIQRFENTFFNLLSLHHTIVDGIDIIEPKAKQARNTKDVKRLKAAGFGNIEYDFVTIKGRDVFEKKYKSMLFEMKHNKRKEEALKIYLRHYGQVATDFAHYFRNLYRIIKQIDSTEFFAKSEIVNMKDNDFQIMYEGKNFEEKYKYTSMVRAQLSDYELAWLFYNCLSINGNKKFKPLIEKYTLLKNMPWGKLLHDIDYKEKYDDSAFEKDKNSNFLKKN